MRRILSQPGAPAFTLVETLLAMGLVATVLLPLIALMGSSSIKQRKTVDRTLGTFIAAGVFDEIGRTEPGKTIRLASPDESGQSHEIELGIAAPGSRSYVTFDIEGKPVRAIPAGDAEGGIRNPLNGEVYLIAIEFSPTPATNRPDLYETKVTVERPVEATRENRITDTLTTFARLAP
ncbi:MAG: hypothetical protein KDN19_20410 [Verrucomicrobiae bacterium]|nr:hypothetical protein [Verrucomicrobiae bacterium]